MPRYRYANDSPKRQDWEDAHEWVRGANRRNVNTRRPVKRRHHPILASVSWADPTGRATLGADLYGGGGSFVNHHAHILPSAPLAPKSVNFWKASIAAMVEADKETVGLWESKPSVALPGDKFLSADRRRIAAMVGTDAQWYAYTERRRKAKQ